MNKISKNEEKCLDPSKFECHFINHFSITRAIRCVIAHIIGVEPWRLHFTVTAHFSFKLIGENLRDNQLLINFSISFYLYISVVTDYNEP